MKRDNEQIEAICFGGEDWWYHNRGHMDFQFMKRFSKKGTVLYLNSIVMQKPKLTHGRSFFRRLARKSRSIFRGLKKSDCGFWVYSPLSFPFHHFSLGRLLNEVVVRVQLQYASRKLGIRNPIVWVACPVACNIAVYMKKSKLVYQRTDRYEEYPNVDSEIIRSYDRILKAEADITIFVNESLYNAESGQCKNAINLDHGVDFEMFACAEGQGYVPVEMRGIKRPVVGFFGGIDNHTMDIEFVRELVDLLKEMSFVFIGAVSVDCSELESRPNVWMLGQKPYEEIARYGKCFDVTIMPWRQNSWIEACNPVKLKEYLALGKPVVSTPFPELQRYRDVVYEAERPMEFARLIEKALIEDSPEYIVARRKKVEKATWDNKAELVLEKLFNHNGFN